MLLSSNECHASQACVTIKAPQLDYGLLVSVLCPCWVDVGRMRIVLEPIFPVPTLFVIPRTAHDADKLWGLYPAFEISFTRIHVKQIRTRSPVGRGGGCIYMYMYMSLSLSLSFPPLSLLLLM